MILFEQIDHVNVVVRDLVRAVAFYRDVLGFQVTMTARLEGEWIERIAGLPGVVADCVYLQPSNGPRIELLRFLSPAGREAQGLTLPNTLGLRHVAFRVDDIDAEYVRMRQAGVEFFGAPVAVPLASVTHVAGRKRLCYFQDTEGTLLEICEYR